MQTLFGVRTPMYGHKPPMGHTVIGGYAIVIDMLLIELFGIYLIAQEKVWKKTEQAYPYHRNIYENKEV